MRIRPAQGPSRALGGQVARAEVHAKPIPQLEPQGVRRDWLSLAEQVLKSKDQPHRT
jgi:hypothetical protein